MDNNNVANCHRKKIKYPSKLRLRNGPYALHDLNSFNETIGGNGRTV
ncbi:MAG TPA: hypothetical protein VF884_05320 [Nitrososphaeraceae archaeon]